MKKIESHLPHEFSRFLEVTLQEVLACVENTEEKLVELAKTPEHLAQSYLLNSIHSTFYLREAMALVLEAVSSGIEKNWDSFLGLPATGQDLAQKIADEVPHHENYLFEISKNETPACKGCPYCSRHSLIRHLAEPLLIKEGASGFVEDFVCSYGTNYSFILLCNRFLAKNRSLIPQITESDLKSFLSYSQFQMRSYYKARLSLMSEPH